MLVKEGSISIPAREVIFQVLLHLLVFLFYSYDEDHPGIEFSQVLFFLNYAVANLILGYLLLPKLFYKKHYLAFFISVVALLATVIFTEEAILEKIFYPDTRGKKFPGVFFSLLDVLPVITILSGFKFGWDAFVKQSEVDQLKDSIRESELQFLKSQINPHFLFNNLNNLYSYAIEGSPNTPKIILELSSVMRYMLYECKEGYVPLTKEIDQMENFVKLSELQIEERGQVSFRKQGITSQFVIAPLILIVFIENAFKHSQSSQSDNILINIEVILKPSGLLTFTCSNNFQKMSNIQSLSNGIGLENVSKRLQLLYPDAHDLEIHDRDDYYTVRLMIQLNSNSDR